MFPFVLILLLGAGLVVVSSGRKAETTPPSSGGEKPSTMIPDEARVTRTEGDFYAESAADEARIKAALSRVLADPLATVSQPASLPTGLTPGVVSFGADAPLQSGERMTFEVVDTDGASRGALEGTFSGPYDPDEGPSTVLVDRVALSRGTSFDVPGKYTIPASSKHSYHDRLRRVVWSVRDPAEKDLKGFSDSFKLDPGDKITVLLRDDFGTYVVGIAQVREVKDDGTYKALLLSPYATLTDEGRGEVTFTRMLAQGLVDVKFSQLVDPKSLKKAAT